MSPRRAASIMWHWPPTSAPPAHGTLVNTDVCCSTPSAPAPPDLVTSGGNVLLVHSEFAGFDRSLEVLRAGGLSTDVVAWQSIPFGPVLLARATWMERTGKLERGRRDEQLVAILAHKS